MPRYVPTYDDLYETRPCFICGREIFGENANTCSPACQQQKESFVNDWEDYLTQEMKSNANILDDDNPYDDDNDPFDDWTDPYDDDWGNEDDFDWGSR